MQHYNKRVWNHPVKMLMRSNRRLHSAPKSADSRHRWHFLPRKAPEEAACSSEGLFLIFCPLLPPKQRFNDSEHQFISFYGTFKRFRPNLKSIFRLLLINPAETRLSQPPDSSFLLLVDSV